MIARPDRILPSAPEAASDPGSFACLLAVLLLVLPSPLRAAPPEGFEARRTRANTELVEGHLEASRTLAAALVAERPDDLEAMGLLAEAQLRLGRLDEAEATTQWLLDMRPTSVEALRATAHFRAATGDVEGAIESFREILARLPVDPTRAAALLEDAATLLRRAGRIADADALHARALALVPKESR